MMMLIMVSFIMYSCKTEIAPDDDNKVDTDGQTNSSVSSDSLEYNPDWTFISHGNADQNYFIVFPQSSVNMIEITLTTTTWNSIRTNMKNLYGYDFGSKSGTGGGSLDSETDYAEVLLKFNGKYWKNVGFRLKGNSSLAQIWGQGFINCLSG